MDGELPSGTVTFFFTDVVGSTRLWEEHPDEMASALARHDAILRTAIDAHRGHVFATAGDSFAVSFHRADDAVRAAVEAQLGLAAEAWPAGAVIRVRTGVHTGEALERSGDYFGSTVNRSARLMTAADGGQVVVSRSTFEVVGDLAAESIEFLDLGPHRLKDLSASQHVYQVAAPGLERSFAPLASVDSVENNLPAVRDDLVGRDSELAIAEELMASASLVSVVGTGGIGKTRFLSAVAARVAHSFPDGVWWCELAPVTDPDALASAVIQALGIRQHSERTAVESVAEYCRRRRLLLVLDNCEHVLEQAAELVETLLAASPASSVLTSSREQLGVAGERLLELRTLRADGADSPAVELFLERASAVNGRREWNATEIETAVRVCDQLDGIPLAIELAASRARSLSLGDIEERLGDAVRLLRSRRRGDERHHTLEATIDWSYKPLGGVARAFFERLSVFAGGWDLAACEAVCADDEMIDVLDVLDLLDDLVAKSLVTVDSSGVHARYRLLEPIRQFAVRRLDDRCSRETIRRAHAEYFSVWAQEWSKRYLTVSSETLAALRGDWSNLRAALNWAVEAADLDVAVRVVTSVEPMLMLQIEHEVGSWALEVLGMPGIDEHQRGPDVASVAASSQWWLADLVGLERSIVRGEAMSAYLIGESRLTVNRGILLRSQGDFGKAHDLYRIRASPDGVGDPASSWLLGTDLAGPSPHQDLEEAAYYRDLLLALALDLDSGLVRAMGHQVASNISFARGEFAEAADFARSATGAASRAAAPFFEHIVAAPLCFAAVAANDVRLSDLEFFERTLREQRAAGQRTDLELTLTGLIDVVSDGDDLGSNVYKVLRAGPWSEHPIVALLAARFGSELTEGEEAAVPDLDDLVDETLARLRAMIGDRR